MTENAVPLYLMDPSRTLISPPPEEELQRNVFGPRSNSTTSMQSKRKRNGTPSKEATPNPKPRKQAHRHSPIPETDLSPTRAAFQRSNNPNADWLPPPSTSSARRSVTPYEPPTDVFKPPPEIIRATPVPAQKARANRQRTTTPQPRSRAQTPLRVIVQTSVKKEMPTIDLSRAMDPPSPTDDPLLLLPSSSPTRTRRSRSRNPPDSSSDLPAFDFTMGPLMDVTDLPTSDSMDLDEPIELPPRVAGPSDWDSDSDDEQEQADNGTLALPTIQLSQPVESLSPAPRPTTTTLSLANFLPTRSTTPPRARSQSRYSLSPAPLVPTQPAVIHEEDEEDDAGLSGPTPVPRTPPRSATTTNANESYTTVLRSTKLDPPTPETKARSDAWGIWGSPYPGRGRGLDGDSNGSFRMDGGFRRGRLLGDMSEEQGPSVDDMQAQAQEDEDDDEEMVEEGVSFFRALREEDEARAKEQQQQQEEEEEEMQQDDDDEEEEEVRRMSVEREAEPEPVIAPMPIRPRPTYVPTEQPTASTSKQAETQTLPIRWKPSRSDHVVTDQADTSVQSTSSSASTSSVSPGPSVFAGRGTRRPSEASGYVDAEKEIASVLSGRDYEVPIAGGDDDGDEEEEEEDLLGLVKITSTDPRAAARAAAILKQHDYDCFTRLRDKEKNRRHSFAGVTKTNSSFSSSSPARPSSKVQDIAELQRKAEKERAKRVVKRRQSARVVGEKVWFPGSPAPVTTSQLLAEAEREVVSSGMSPKLQSTISAKASWDASVSTPARPASASASVSGRRSSLAREIPLPESDSEEDSSHVREWTKADWKALDACFTDERIAVAERLGMVLNLSVAPPAKDANESFAFSTPVKQTVGAGAGADGNVVMMASVDAVDVAAVVERFEGRMGGRREMKGWGEAWDTETLLQRVRSLQVKQRSGHVAPPTPRSSAAIENTSTSSIFSKRQATMEVPDFTPLGKRAMPPALSSASRRPRLPEPVLGGPFSNLPPTPEPAKRRRVPGSLLAPRYSHLLDEAKVVAGSSTTVQEQDEEEEMEEQETEADTSGEQEHPETSFEDSSFEDVDAEMVPATPLREQPPAAPPPAPATIGNRVKGFLFSYLPTLANTAPPVPPRTNLMHGRPRLPLPPLEILQKPRGPVTTPARPPLPKTTAPKDLVTLQQAPPPKTMIPRKAVVPKRMKDLKHVSPPPELPPVREGPRPRTASGGSVKDLVKNFEAMDKGKGKAQEVKRVKSVGNLGNNAGAARRPAWR